MPVLSYLSYLLGIEVSLLSPGTASKYVTTLFVTRILNADGMLPLVWGLLF